MVKTVAPDKWSRMQGLHQDYRILCALGVIYVVHHVLGFAISLFK